MTCRRCSFTPWTSQAKFPAVAEGAIRKTERPGRGGFAWPLASSSRSGQAEGSRAEGEGLTRAGDSISKALNGDKAARRSCDPKHSVPFLGNGRDAAGFLQRLLRKERRR